MRAGALLSPADTEQLKKLNDEESKLNTQFQDNLREECNKAGVDYVGMDTSVSFDKALLEYLIQRQRRF